jgi:response regulator NasT
MPVNTVPRPASPDRPAAAPALRVLAADPNPAARQFYQAALARLGYDVGAVATGEELAAACRQLAPDVVLTGPAGLAEAQAACADRPAAIVLVAADPEPAAVARAAGCEGVMACLPWPVGEAALGAAVALAARRFADARAARAEAAELRQALEDRKVIERAKGATMRRCGVDEAEAYRRMRTLANDHNWKMIDVARRVVAAEAVFAELEDRPTRHEPAG